jgi:hypothetical protein
MPNFLALTTRLLVVIAVGALAGCQMAKQKELFPDIYAAERPAQLDVLVDVTVLEDLDDKDLGVDLERNRLWAKNSQERIGGILRNAGYRLNEIRSGYGLVWRPDAAQAVYLAQDRRTTGLRYMGPEARTGADPWIEDDARDFLKTLLMTARILRDDADDLTSFLEVAALAHVPPPAAFKELQSRYLLMVHVSVYDAIAAKEAAALLGGIAVGVGMAAAGSPIAVVPYFRTSYTRIELVLFDNHTGQIAWSASRISGDDGRRDLEYFMSGAAATFPAHEGRKARYPRRSTRR